MKSDELPAEIERKIRDALALLRIMRDLDPSAYVESLQFILDRLPAESDEAHKVVRHLQAYRAQVMVDDGVRH